MYIKKSIFAIIRETKLFFQMIGCRKAVFSLLFFALFFVGSNNKLNITEFLLQKVKPFVVLIVNNDNSEYVNMVVLAANSNEAFKRLIAFETVKNKPENIQELFSFHNQVAGVIEIPKGFTESVLNGNNMPFIMYVNQKMPLESQIVTMLAKSGTSFLRVSQSGIYATIYFVYEQGKTQEFVEKNIVMPINIAYAHALLQYGNNFTTKQISFTEQITIMDYYVRSISFFLVGLFSLFFYFNIQKTMSQDILDRHFSLGNSRFLVFFTKWCGLFFTMLTFLLPFLLIFKAYYVLIVFYASAYVIFVNTWIKNQTNGAFFIVMSSGMFLFLSGGIIPLSFLPKAFSYIALLCPPYHAIRMETGAFMIFVFGVVLLGISLASFVGFSPVQLKKQSKVIGGYML